VVEKKPASEIQRLAMEEGMLTMKQDGYVKVLKELQLLKNAESSTVLNQKYEL
jgi:type II secretory ATPase GspE/PulE/Tfp pilus assembly ATPase PilB-like protein